jgi:hypothetical protein
MIAVKRVFFVGVGSRVSIKLILGIFCLEKLSTLGARVASKRQSLALF